MRSNKKPPISSMGGLYCKCSLIRIPLKPGNFRLCDCACFLLPAWRFPNFQLDSWKGSFFILQFPPTLGKVVRNTSPWGRSEINLVSQHNCLVSTNTMAQIPYGSYIFSMSRLFPCRMIIGKRMNLPPRVTCHIYGETEHITLYCPNAKEIGF